MNSPRYVRPNPNAVSALLFVISLCALALILADWSEELEERIKALEQRVEQTEAAK